MIAQAWPQLCFWFPSICSPCIAFSASTFIQGERHRRFDARSPGPDKTFGAAAGGGSGQASRLRGLVMTTAIEREKRLWLRSLCKKLDAIVGGWDQGGGCQIRIARPMPASQPSRSSSSPSARVRGLPLCR